MQNELTTCLTEVLSNTYALYFKTQHYHWNVEGEHFYALHTMFEKQYEELAKAIDELAELIRQYGLKVKLDLNNLPVINTAYNAAKMIDDLLQEHQLIQEIISETISCAQKTNQEVVVEMLVSRLSQHKKIVWILQSSK